MMRLSQDNKEDTAVPNTTHTPGRGNALGFWFFRMALKLTGLRGAYGLLYFVCGYYALVDRHAITSAGAYLRHRFPSAGGCIRRWKTYQLFISQGKCLIDRLAYNVGACKFELDTHGCVKIFRQLEEAPNGFILLLSHTGGWQLALPHLEAGTGARPVSLLMHEAETADVRQHVRGNDAGFNIISPDLGPAAAVEMVTRLQRGEIVSIMGDRAYGGQTTDVSFLGDTAYFPASAFAVARAAECPVLALFVPKTGPFSYTVEAVLFEAPSRKNRQSIRQGVQDYAQALEAFLQEHPNQSFVFYDLWKKASSGPADA